MKKLLSIFLSVSLLFLCSCSLLYNNEEEMYISFDEISDKKILSLDLNDRYISIVTTTIENYYPDYVEEEIAENDDIYNVDYFIYSYDYLFKRCLKEYHTTSKELYEIYGIEINDENEITLISSDEEKESIIFNLKFKEIDKVKKEVLTDYNNYPHNNKLIDYNRFPCLKDFYYYTGINKEISLFNDINDFFFISEYDMYNNVVDVNEKEVLRYKNDYKKECSLTLTNYDTLSNKKINLDDKYFDYYFGEIKSYNNKYALVLGNESTYGDTILIWDTNLAATYNADNIEKINAENIDSHIEKLTNEIKSNYNIELECYKKYSKNSNLWEYKYTNKLNKTELIITLYDLDYCLSTFPTELYSEIIEGGDFFNGFKKFKIYLVGAFDVEEGIDAYCSNENEELYIVYSVGSFSYSTFCHELMHSMEYRIWNYDTEFDIKWEKKNPNNFIYPGRDEASTYYYENEDIQDYFARDYGLTNILEDRATVFEAVCDCANSKEEIPWWNDKSQFIGKAKLLKQTIEKSFPSLKNNPYPLSYYDNL